MRAVFAAAFVAGAAVVQLALGSRFEVAAAMPNLVVVLVAAIAWTLGTRAGLLSACAGGVLLDLGSPGPLGAHALALLPGAYAIGWWPRPGKEAPYLLAVGVSAALATLVYSGVLLGIDLLAGGYIPSLATGVRLAAGAALYSGLLAPFAVPPVRALCLGRISRRAQA